MNDSYILERIREIWSKLSNDKRRFLDVLFHAAGRKLLGDTLAEEYVPIRDSQSPPKIAQLPEVHILIEAVYLMPDVRLGTGFKDPRLAVVPYLGEALGAIVERDAVALFEYSKPYEDLGDSAEAARIENGGAYAEAYNSWVEKTALYLQECRSTVRAVSFNEFTQLWDKSFGIDYLATHSLLKTKRGCDSRRVFIYDKTYWENRILLKRLFAEIHIQLEAGVHARVCSMEQLQQIGKGYAYPLLSFGTYDRSALGVLIPHDTYPVVKLIHDEKQIRDASIMLDDIFDHAEPGTRWIKRNASLFDSAVGDFINLRVASLHRAINSRSLD